MRNYVNIRVAVALDDGLIVPLIKYANTLELLELSIKFGIVFSFSGEITILGIATMEDAVVGKNGQVEILPTINLCLTVDYRAVDVVIAVQFRERLKEIIENPALLLL